MAQRPFRPFSSTLENCVETCDMLHKLSLTSVGCHDELLTDSSL